MPVEMKQLVVERLVVDLEADPEEDPETDPLVDGMAIVSAGTLEGVGEQRILLVYRSYLEEVLACLLEVEAAWFQFAVGRSLDLLLEQGYIG